MDLELGNGDGTRGSEVLRDRLGITRGHNLLLTYLVTDPAIGETLTATVAGFCATGGDNAAPNP
jgi:hypothetical protein